MKIESQDIDIETLLDGSYFFIPRFQRPYSWDGENIGDFWNDLVANQDNDYFIGSMVVYKRSKQEFGVVDGQQRLTTITIMLCVIRDYFNLLGCDDFASGIHQLIERKNRENINTYTLKTETSFPYFQEYIQKFKESPDVDVELKKEEESLRDAHEKFKLLIGDSISSVDLDKMIQEEEKRQFKIDKLKSLRDSVLNLNLILVTLDNEDDAYLIFETLNTRGKDLALTDLVKNHFSKHMKKKGDVDSVTLKWEKMLETIHYSSAELSTDTFIYHYWASRYDYIPLKKLFPIFRKTVTRARAKEFLDEIVNDSSLYRSIYETSYGWNKNEADAARSLSALQTFKVVQPLPALLSLVRSYKMEVIRYRKLREMLNAIEKFHFVFTAVTSSRSSGGISAMYSSFAQKLYGAKNSDDALRYLDELLDKLRSRVPSFDEFLVSFREIQLTNSFSKQKKLVRYILRKFSEYYQYRYSVDYDDLTIEHLEPQSSIGKLDWDESNVGCLGNLFFLESRLNNSLDNKSYKEKIVLLKNAGSSLPQFVEDAQDWTPQIVRDHLDEMANTAYYEIWNLKKN